MKKQIAISIPLIFSAFVAYAASGSTTAPATEPVESAEKEQVEMCMLNGELVPEVENDYAKDQDEGAYETEDHDYDDHGDAYAEEKEGEVEPCDDVDSEEAPASSNG